MTCMRAWMSSKFGRIRPRTTELAAVERMKRIPFYLFIYTIFNEGGTISSE